MKIESMTYLFDMYDLDFWNMTYFLFRILKVDVDMNEFVFVKILIKCPTPFKLDSPICILLYFK